MQESRSGTVSEGCASVRTVVRLTPTATRTQDSTSCYLSPSPKPDSDIRYASPREKPRGRPKAPMSGGLGLLQPRPVRRAPRLQQRDQLERRIRQATERVPLPGAGRTVPHPIAREVPGVDRHVRRHQLGRVGAVPAAPRLLVGDDDDPVVTVVVVADRRSGVGAAQTVEPLQHPQQRLALAYVDTPVVRAELDQVSVLGAE